jgi:hypothetical protein
MKTGDFRGARPFAAEWILEEGRQAVPAGHAPRLLRHIHSRLDHTFITGCAPVCLMDG